MNPSSRSSESFKLLQLSEDSKSLSDLELPEIATQRRRKVRRYVTYLLKSFIANRNVYRKDNL